MRTWIAALTLVVCSACSYPQVTADLRDESPSPDLGRPAWVRYCAEAGSYVGAAAGGVVAVVCLPVTFPLSLLAEKPLGYSKNEFMFFPVSIGAGAGQYVLGAPTDMLDFMFYRAWAGDRSIEDYEYEPVPPPIDALVGEEGAGAGPKPAEIEVQLPAEKPAGEPDKDGESGAQQKAEDR